MANTRPISISECSITQEIAVNLLRFRCFFAPENSVGAEPSDEWSAGISAVTVSLTGELDRLIRGLVAEQKQELAQELALAFQQLQQREQLLDARERILELRAASLSRQNSNQTIQISQSEIQIWRRQAMAIGRSSRHLESIDLVSQDAKKGDDFVEISEKVFQIRCLDQDEFNRRAFQLME